MMKKYILLTVFGMLGVAVCFAQAPRLTAEELRFRNGIQQFLKQKGYVVTIDNDDNSLNWEVEGAKYWLIVYNSSPTYIELHVAGFNTEGCNRNLILQACNRAANGTRCAKAYADENDVAFSVELFCNSVEEFKQVFDSSISPLNTMRDRVQTYFNELDEQSTVSSAAQQSQQEISSADDNVYDVVDQMPMFPGGSSGLSAYLSQNIKYPLVAEENGIQGRVLISCVIDHDGSVTEVKVTKSVDPSLDKEALRVVKAMPKWTPGTLNGKKVRVRYTIPVSFKL